ncbi:hypothetical protein WICMUC_002650 [Wickerhamomyces mucosus]|uniref:Ribosomal protein L10 n=1 Tax=Wickerhamomyces mucosus TaxID=1378264 RepID=A0A9P8TEM7_9ASCO|nr:hypothetical protein WICMUC_002650 [Wickerhamomyces mucosus]
MLRISNNIKTFINPIRFYSVASNTSSSSIQYLKNEESRKTYLINRYQYLLKDSEIVLFVHHNNLIKNEINQYRNQIRELGGDLHIIRNKLFNAYLRAENELNPASLEAFQRTKSIKHPFKPLLNGPSGIITVKNMDPTIVLKIIKYLNKTTNEKLFLIGARIENKLFDLIKLNEFKDLKPKDQLQSELAGLLTVLSGVGLVQTLSSASQHLYLTLESHRENNEPKDEGNESIESSSQQ